VLLRTRFHQCVHQRCARRCRVGSPELMDEHFSRAVVQTVAVVVENGEWRGSRGRLESRCTCLSRTRATRAQERALLSTGCGCPARGRIRTRLPGGGRLPLSAVK
jgi:hypothetical protein